MEKLFRNSSSLLKYDPCKTAKVFEAWGDLMSKCWSRLEAALASELNSSKNVKQFYRKECLSLACQGHFLLVFLLPFSTTVYPFMYLSAVLDTYTWQKCWYWFAFCRLGGSSVASRDVKMYIHSPFLMAGHQQSFVPVHCGWVCP